MTYRTVIGCLAVNVNLYGSKDSALRTRGYWQQIDCCRLSVAPLVYAMPTSIQDPTLFAEFGSHTLRLKNAQAPFIATVAPPKIVARQIMLPLLHLPDDIHEVVVVL